MFHPLSVHFFLYFPFPLFSLEPSHALWIASGQAGLHAFSSVAFLFILAVCGFVCAFRAGREAEKKKDGEQDSDSVHHPLHSLTDTRGVELPSFTDEIYTEVKYDRLKYCS